MAITHQQSRTVHTSANGSQALDFLSTPQAGCMVVVCVSSYNGDVVAGDITDNQGNTYSQGYKLEPYGDVDLALFYCLNVNSSGTFTVTVNPPISGGCMAFTISEFRGVATSSALDQSNTANSGGTPGTAVNSGNVTPTENNELLIGVMIFENSSTIAITEDTSEGWALIGEEENNSTYSSLGVEYIIQTTAAQQDADWTLGSTSNWAAFIVSFKEASGITALEINICPENNSIPGVRIYTP